MSLIKFSTLTGGAGKAELDGKGFMKLCEDWLGRVGLRGRFDSEILLCKQGSQSYESVFSF